MSIKKRTYTTTFYKALGIITTSFLTGIVGTAITIFAVVNTDHFVLDNLVRRVDAIEEGQEVLVTKQYLDERFAEQARRLDEFKKSIDYLIDIHIKR